MEKYPITVSGKVGYKYIEIGGKGIHIPQKEIDNLMKTLELTEQEAIQTWLDDNDYTTNEVVEELTKKAKENKTTLINKARENVENKKTTRERKENPTKELIIAEIAKTLQTLGVGELKIENKAKIITFAFNNECYKVDLVQKRKSKA